MPDNIWKRLNIHKSLIKRETMKAVLIAMPHSSDYDGYSFWHPQKCVFSGPHKGAITISFTDSFEFRLMDKEGYEETLSAEEMIDQLEEMSNSITPRRRSRKQKLMETHVPAPLTPSKTEAIEELRDE